MIQYFHETDIFHPLTRLGNQYKAETPNGNFYVDFVLNYAIRLIGIECDGKKYHSETHDFYRDALILYHTKIENIYRIKSKDIL